MTGEQIVLLFMGPIIALLGGAMIYFVGPALESWERRRARRGSGV